MRPAVPVVVVVIVDGVAVDDRQHLAAALSATVAQSLTDLIVKEQRQ